MTARRPHAVATALLLLLASATLCAHGRTDIPTQLQELTRTLTTAPPAPARLNTALASALGNSSLAAFSPTLQHALLWDAGYVRAAGSGAGSSASYLDVYVLCGRTMNDVFIDVDAIAALSTSCPLKSCKQFSLNYAQSGCDADALVASTLCAVVAEDIAALASPVATASGLPSWAQEGHIDETFVPQLTQQKGGAAAATLYLVSEKATFSGTDTSCPVTTSFVAPCREVPRADVTLTNEEKQWCHPSSQLGVQLWLKSEMAALAGTTKSGSDTSKSGADANQNSGSSDTKSSSSTAAVVLGIALGVAVLACIVLLVLYCRKRKTSNQKTIENPETPGYTAVNVNAAAGAQRYSTGTNQSSNSVNIEAVNEAFKQKSQVLAAFCDDQELMIKRIAFTGLYFRKLIASGANGEVWRGEYAGQQVAIKRTFADKKEDIKTLEDFSSEIRLASGLEHPNIVRFVGLSWRALPDLCMVSEFMAVGDLAHFLETKEGKNMSWGEEKVGLAADIANALVYLHSLMPVVIHRDLKSLNVLLTEDLQAKLSDFGLSRERAMEQTMTSGIGTMLWTAPEVLRGERYSEKADIYSFGVVLSELDTCLAPYALNDEMVGVTAKSKRMHLLPLISNGKIMPKFSPECPQPVLELAQSCLDQDPSKRPPAMQIVYALRSKIRPVL